MNPALSLTMIVQNEETNLAECLSCVADFVQEIIVIDTGSSDRSREIARQFGAQVYDFRWCDDFAAARNEALRHARSPWLFWMDADDRLDPPRTLDAPDPLTLATP
ncbi:MAG: glycosyltransferase family 2 protein [Pirellulales bacterium]